MIASTASRLVRTDEISNPNGSTNPNRPASERSGASFSRALAEDLHYDLTDTEFNDTISNNINMIKAASE